MSGWPSSVSTASLSPLTTLKTPSGTPASASSSAVSIEADGSFSDGFSTNVFPQASAGAHIHMGTTAGKVNGGEQAGEILPVGREELADPEEQLGAARQRY